MADVNASVGSMSVKYSYDRLVVEIRLREGDSARNVVSLSYSEALTLTDLLNFVMPNTSCVRVRDKQ